jgi:hypothetical protein
MYDDVVVFRLFVFEFAKVDLSDVLGEGIALWRKICDLIMAPHQFALKRLIEPLLWREVQHSCIGADLEILKVHP